MQTMKRLTAAFEDAFTVNIDSNSKLIFFSDVHRGDNSISDEFAHNQNIYYYALTQYLDQGFTYIEVGDGDELWEHSKFKHVRSAHSDIYLLLRDFFEAGRAHFIYGNHNMDFKNKHYTETHAFEFFDEYTEQVDRLFAGVQYHEAIKLHHTEQDKEIFVVHGHQGDFINDHLWRFTKYLNRHFWHYLHIVGFTNPASPSKNMHKRHKIEKNYSQWIKQHQKMLIVGHTHRPKFPSDGDEPYFNTGSCVYPRNITGIEVENDQIALVDWRIRPDDDGKLVISRRVMQGPEPLAKFMR